MTMMMVSMCVCVCVCVCVRVCVDVCYSSVVRCINVITVTVIQMMKRTSWRKRMMNGDGLTSVHIMPSL